MGRGRGFGLSSNRGKRGSGSRGYRGNSSWRGGRGRGRGRGGAALPSDSPAPVREDDGTLLAERFEKVTLNDEIDEKMGFPRVQEGARREGWLVNMRPVRSYLSVDSIRTFMIYRQ
jgi:DNA polymerase epsilon subunit 1